MNNDSGLQVSVLGGWERSERSGGGVGWGTGVGAKVIAVHMINPLHNTRHRSGIQPHKGGFPTTWWDPIRRIMRSTARPGTQFATVKHPALVKPF